MAADQDGAGGKGSIDALRREAAGILARIPQQGGSTAILGRSGAGKTSLLRAMEGVRWAGQGRGAGNVVLVRTDRAASWRTAGGVAGADALARAGLGALASRRMGTLCSGERQAVMLARAIARGAAALLLDDPDPALLAAARRSAVPVLFATPHPELALTADRLVVLHQARVLREGSAIEIYEEPQLSSVAGLLGAANVIRGTVREVHPTGFAWTAAGQRFRQTLLPGTERPPLGREVMLLLWPERVVPLLPEDASDNAVAGTAVMTRLVGGRPVLDLDTALGRLLAALGPYAPPAPGSAVRVGWAAGAASLLREG